MAGLDSAADSPVDEAERSDEESEALDSAVER
jgi:hypothetical protein